MANELRETIANEMTYIFHGLLRGRIPETFIDHVEHLVEEDADDIWNTEDVFIAIANTIGDLLENQAEEIKKQERPTLREWLDSAMGVVTDWDDVLDYLPEWHDRLDPGNPYHIWTENGEIHCDSRYDADTVGSWLVGITPLNPSEIVCEVTDKGDWVVKIEKKPEVFDYIVYKTRDGYTFIEDERLYGDMEGAITFSGRDAEGSHDCVRSACYENLAGYVDTIQREDALPEGFYIVCYYVYRDFGLESRVDFHITKEQIIANVLAQKYMEGAAYFLDPIQNRGGDK